MLRARLDGDYPLKSSIFIHSRSCNIRVTDRVTNRGNRGPNRTQS